MGVRQIDRLLTRHAGIWPRSPERERGLAAGQIRISIVAPNGVVLS